MDRARAKELAPVIQAYGEGKAVQYRPKGASDWMCGGGNYGWFDDFDYRIKPEPSTRPMTRGEVLYMVTTTPAMVVRYLDDKPELPTSFSYDVSIESYEYAIIDEHGDPVDGWHKFEVEE